MTDLDGFRHDDEQERHSALAPDVPAQGVQLGGGLGVCGVDDRLHQGRAEPAIQREDSFDAYGGQRLANDVTCTVD